MIERRLEHESGEARVLRRVARAGAGRDRSDRLHAVVRAHAGGVGARAVDGGCGQDSGGGGAQAEDGCAGCGAYAGAAAQQRFPRIWLPIAGRARSAAVGVASAEAGADASAVKNQMHALAMGQGVCRKKKLWSQRRARRSWRRWRWGRGRATAARVAADAGASWRRCGAGPGGGASGPRVRRLAALLMTHPGVGPVTSLAFVLTMGPVERFQRGKQVVSYLGLNPQRAPSGGQQRLGSISKQGNSMMRWLLVEAGQTAARLDPRTAASVSAVEVATRSVGGEGRRGPQAGREVVLDAAQHGRLRAAGSHAGQPEGHPGGRTVHRWAEWAPRLPEESGSLNNESWSK